MNGIGKNIKKLRKDSNLSQEQLGGLLHVTRQAVSSWENGKNQPDIETLEAIAAVFNTDILMILYGRPQPVENEELKRNQRRRYIRNAVIWGTVAFLGLLVYLLMKNKVMEWYYRSYYAVPTYLFGLFVKPLCFFAAAASFMNLLCLAGDIRIKQIWLRRTVFWISLAFLIWYLAAAFYCMIPAVIPGAGDLFTRIFGGSTLFFLLYRFALTPVVFLAAGAGVFLGGKQ